MTERLALLFDAVGEDWPSMELCGQMLLEQLRAHHANRLLAEPVQPQLPRLFRRTAVGSARLRWNADRAVGRYLAYPARVVLARRRFAYFHVVDHSYAHLANVLPPGRTGVFCHDLDLFRCLLEPAAERRSAAFRALARVVLHGLERAALVFHTTAAVRTELVRHGFVDPARLVHAPLGVAPEFHPGLDPEDRSSDVLAPLGGRPFVLHVGADMPRKRLDLVFEIFAELRRRHPQLRLVQQGGTLSPERTVQIERLGIERSLLRPPRLDRPTLAGLYRKAAVVLVPSEAEGFGLPVIEALACGTPVVASELPSLREAGGDAASYCPVGDVAAWTEAASRALDDRGERAGRLAQAARFTWANHAQVIADAYGRLSPR